jgi:hypothetical protein
MRHAKIDESLPEPQRRAEPALPLPSPAVLALHNGAGNRAVAALLRRSRPPGPGATTAQRVRDEVVRGRIADGEEPVPAGMQGPPAPASAFWILNGLAPAELLEVLRALGADVRAQLLAHVGETAGRYDTPRLAAALRAQAAGEHAAGVRAIELLDETRRAQASGSFAAVWGHVSGRSRPELIATLRILPRETRALLQGRLAEAPAADRPKLTDVLADLLDTGTDMAADDVIDLQPLRGLDRLMASIYNQRGRMLFEQASALGINTAAAAGIMKVESGGQTFNAATDKAIMRFENHQLWRRWGRSHAASFDAHFQFARGKGESAFTGHRYRDSATDPWSDFHGNQERERHVLDLAVRVAGDVAYECASFGAGQVMGFNHALLGFPSAKEMVERYDRGERAQITGIFEYIRGAHLADAVKRGDFEAVASGYNGPGQVKVYAGLMREAAQAYARVTAGRRNVIP